MAVELTTKEVAEELNIPLGTLKSWLNKIPVPVKTDSAGNRRFGDAELEVIRQIQALRLDEGRGMETIRRRLNLEIQDETKTHTGSVPDEAGSNPDESQPQIPPVDTSLIVAQVIEAIAGQTELAEKYARAAHQIGRLEAENQFLKDQLASANEKIALLEAPKETAPIQAPSKPWWKIW